MGGSAAVGDCEQPQLYQLTILLITTILYRSYTRDHGQAPRNYSP